VPLALIISIYNEWIQIRDDLYLRKYKEYNHESILHIMQ
jgi:hypothetical protein